MISRSTGPNLNSSRLASPDDRLITAARGSGPVPDPFTNPQLTSSNAVPNAQYAPAAIQMRTTKQCPNCASQVFVGSSVCSVCGEPLHERQRTVRCRHCSAQASNNLTLCPSCGRELRAAPARALVWGLPVAVAVLMLIVLAGRWDQITAQTVNVVPAVDAPSLAEPNLARHRSPHPNHHGRCKRRPGSNCPSWAAWPSSRRACRALHWPLPMRRARRLMRRARRRWRTMQPLLRSKRLVSKRLTLKRLTLKTLKHYRPRSRSRWEPVPPVADVVVADVVVAAAPAATAIVDYRRHRNLAPHGHAAAQRHGHGDARQHSHLYCSADD